MPGYQKNTSIGLLLLVLFSVNVSWVTRLTAGKAALIVHSAQVYQDTAYPAVSDTPPSDNGYPAQETATAPVDMTASPYPAQGTIQSTAISTMTPAPGTPSVTAGTPNDVYLTENAEMGQSNATPLPSETMAPSATETETLALQAMAPIDEPAQGFRMNWGVLIIGFFGILLVGGGAGWWALRRRGYQIKIRK